jgi:hypothetical protein
MDPNNFLVIAKDLFFGCSFGLSLLLVLEGVVAWRARAVVEDDDDSNME